MDNIKIQPSKQTFNQNMDFPRVSVIIVTFQNERDIHSCLAALWNQNFPDFEVILMDNHSTDSTVPNISENSRLRVVALQENRGFTGANIEGLKIARAEYVALLNPDTEVTPGWLEHLTQAMDEHPEVGICASKLIVSDTTMIDSAGDGCTTTGKGFKRGEGDGIGRFNRPDYVFGACGGAMLIRRKMIAEIGFLDDAFFLIQEDTDFCFRAQLAGWKCLYVPDALVFHKVGASIKRVNGLGIYYAVRNSKFVITKNMPLVLLMKYSFQLLLQEAGIFLYFGVKHRFYRVYFRALRDYLIFLPVLLKKRKEIQKLRVLKVGEIDNLLTSLWQDEVFHKKWQKFRFQ